MERFFLGQHNRPYCIAEMSGNHNSSLDRALAIVDAAADAGAHAVKLQTYTADTMTIDSDSPDFLINQSDSLWNGRKLYDLYTEAATPWEWHVPIQTRCRERGMAFFSTPFDDTSVEFLETLQVPFYKIASFELTDIPLIRRVAKCRKPMIMSAGMATFDEIAMAVSEAREFGCPYIAILKCTSTYPSDPRNSNVSTIPDMIKRLGVEVGLSDHTLGVGAAIAAVALGASVIEKHFTLRRADGGVDSAFSMEPDEFRALVDETGRAFQSLGSVTYGPTKAERASLKFRRSIYATKDIAEGAEFNSENIRVIRPGYGLPPASLEMVLKSKARVSIKRGTPISEELLAKERQ